MTHTETVSMILDGTRASGLLFHVLSETERAKLKTAGRAYMLAHATGDVAGRITAEVEILRSVGR